MNISDCLARYNFTPQMIEAVTAPGLKEFYPPQAQAIEKGALTGKNLLMSVPTAAGKTLIAELCMLKAVLQDRGKCLYIVPLKALAGEKYQDFHDKYKALGVKVGIATGDLDTPGHKLTRFDIVIATAEKVDSLFRARAPWLINGLGLAVLDEIHFLNDGSRGPTLEILAARIKQMNPKAQILALSATVFNAEEMARWLNAELVLSDWRPIPLREGVYFDEKIKFLNYPEKELHEDAKDDLGKLCLDTLRGKGQLLVFVNSRRSAQAASRQIASYAAMALSVEEKQELVRLSKEAVGSPSEATKICRQLGLVLKNGAAFHHAGLKPNQRKLVEDAFKKNLVKVICATPTLAAGVNLPARRAILRDYKRYESGLGSAFIPTSEYKQCAGRAGRPQFDTFGEAVIMAKSLSESKVLFDRYIKADPEPIISKLGEESVLRIHLLASVAGGYVHDVNDTLDFLSHTFFAKQNKQQNLLELVSNIFDFLETEGFLEKQGFRYFATEFGQCTSRLYIDPMTAIILRNGLRKMQKGKSFSSVGILHMLCATPDQPLLTFGKNELEDIQGFAATFEDEFVLDAEDVPTLGDFMVSLSILKSTMLLSRWIEEDREEVLCDTFGIGPGDIFRHTQSAEWLLHATTILTELFGFKKLSFPVEHLRSRVKYGIKEELLKLTALKGVGRVRARKLFEAGFTSPSELKSLDIETLAAVETIGKTIAREILDQVQTSSSSYKDDLRSLAAERLKNFRQ